MKDITSNKYFIPGFAVAVTIIVVLVLVVFRGGVPGDAVASVNGETVSKAKFNDILKIYASQSQPNAKGAPVVPDPPTYTKCIANKRKTAPKKSSVGALRNQCKNEWETAREQIMTTLIQSHWYKAEAEERGLKITAAEVKQRFLPLKQQTFPKEADYKKFLQTTGQSEADLLQLVKTEMIKEKIREQVTKSKPPTNAEVKAAYEKKKDDYATPASRDLLVVYANKKSKIDQAAAALKNGDSFAAVAKKYSEDTASKGNGGKFPGVTEGQFEPKLNKAIFSAKKGARTGPIKVDLGYYIFEVTKITTKTQQSLKEASATIRQTLISEKQTSSFDKFQVEFNEKWRKKTKCGDLYKISLCKNGPKPEPTGATGAKK